MWFTADDHFGHNKVIVYSNRPYQTVEEMNEALIANWNARVDKKDLVWHLGDFCFRKDAFQFYTRLNGLLKFCRGNHDREHVLEKLVGSENVHDTAYIRYQGERFWLSHYAHRTWRKSNHGSYHLYGHSHGDLPGLGRSMDVGVDAQQYAPIHVDEVIARLANAGNTNHHAERP